MKNKQQLREYIKQAFKEQETDSINKKNISIIEKVNTYLSINSFKHICIYESLNDEVKTKDYIEELRENWYKIYTPQVISETEMIIIDENYEHYEKEIDVFIIPGRAFSYEGKRLGRGNWYYDRFLSQKIYKKSRKIWIWYDFQILEDIPTLRHDIIMNKIFTND